jgi:hypothetical protein
MIQDRNIKIIFGKYKGLSIADVMSQNPGYLLWAHYKVKELKLSLELFSEATALFEEQKGHPFYPQERLYA